MPDGAHDIACNQSLGSANKTLCESGAAPLLAAWTELRELARRRRDTRRELLALRPAIANLLLEMHAQLACPGPNGAFAAFLRSIRMPRRTAYRLIAQYAPASAAVKAGACSDLGCANETTIPGGPQPVLSLSRSTLRVHFDPVAAAIVFTRLDASLERPHFWRGSRFGCNPAHIVTAALTDSVQDERVAARLQELWNLPAQNRPSLSRFLPRLVFY